MRPHECKPDIFSVCNKRDPPSISGRFLLLNNNKMTNRLTQEQLLQLVASAFTVDAELQEGQHLRVEDFDKPTGREYWVSIKGSLRDLQGGRATCTWSARRNCEHIYQRIAGVDPESKQPEFEGDTTKGVIMDMKVRTISSTFPVDIGAVITGVHGKSFMDNGKNYAFIAEANRSYDQEFSIFDPVAPITRSDLKNYNEAGVAELDTQIAGPLSDGTTLVHNFSPIAKMLRINATVLNVPGFALAEGVEGWLQVPTQIVDACVSTYKANKTVEFVDFNKFNVAFERVDAATWDEPIGVIDNLIRKAKTEGGAVDDSRLDKICYLKAKVYMDFVLYGPSPPNANAITAQ